MNRNLAIPTAVAALFALFSTAFAAAAEVRIDHILWATPDLEVGAERFETLSGVTPVFGGAHPGRGTANNLASLGEHTYLEIIGPNPDAPHESEPRVEVMRTMTAPAIMTFAISTNDLDTMAAAAQALGMTTEGPNAGARDKPDGETLRWRSLNLGGHDFGNAIPFAIDWGTSTHPATTSPKGVELISLLVRHPRADALRHVYQALGIPVHVEAGETAEFVARIGTPKGEIELRGDIPD